MNIFSKFNQNEYNNRLEKILENKTFDEDVKNLLLSMLYKIENGYNDYSKAKVDAQSKDEFMNNILKTIEKDCFEIKVVTPETEEALPLAENKTVCIIEPDDGKILVYANEEDILYSIILMRILQKEIIYKLNNENMDKDSYYKNAIKDFIIKAKCINDIEVIRDFDGWSWNNNLKTDIDIKKNLIYQNIIMAKLNTESPVFYEEKFEQSINSGNEFEKSIFISILSLQALENEELRKHIIVQTDEKLKLMKAMENRKKFLDTITEEKKQINLEIKKIDEILNDQNKLKEEYKIRNSKLPNKEKIFSISHLATRLEKERNEKLELIKQKNKLIEPLEYVKLQEKLEREYNVLNKIIENTESKEKIEEGLINTQKEFLKIYEKNIESYTSKEDWEKVLYQFRYYCLIPISKEKNIYDVKELQRQIEKTINVIIDNCIDKQIITNYSNSISLCYTILKYVFASKIIDFKEISIKINKQKEEKLATNTEYYITVGIYDSKEAEGIFEEQVDNLKLLNVKPNKKINLILK